jgi:hypothetical protein
LFRPLRGHCRPYARLSPQRPVPARYCSSRPDQSDDPLPCCQPPLGGKHGCGKDQNMSHDIAQSVPPNCCDHACALCGQALAALRVHRCLRRRHLWCAVRGARSRFWPDIFMDRGSGTDGAVRWCRLSQPMRPMCRHVIYAALALMPGLLTRVGRRKKPPSDSFGRPLGQPNLGQNSSVLQRFDRAGSDRKRHHCLPIWPLRWTRLHGDPNWRPARVPTRAIADAPIVRGKSFALKRRLCKCHRREAS